MFCYMNTYQVRSMIYLISVFIISETYHVIWQNNIVQKRQNNEEGHPIF